MLTRTNFGRVGSVRWLVLFLVMVGNILLHAQTVPQHFHGTFFCASEKPGYAEMTLAPVGSSTDLHSSVQIKSSSKGYFDFGSMPARKYVLTVKESCGKTWKAIHHLELEADSRLFEELGCGSKERPIDIRFEYGDIHLNIGACW